MKYGNKKDANHAVIIQAFEKFGCPVLDLSSMGCGVPDLLISCRSELHLVDIKNLQTGYGRKGLNKRQQKWALEWQGGPVYLIHSIEEVADFVAGRLEKIVKFGGYMATMPSSTLRLLA
jgi:hypothetical protein